MSKQLIISLGREFGSGGHVVAKLLAEHYQIPLYDHNLLKDIASEHHVDAEDLKKYDEHPRNLLLSRTVNGFSNSPEENVAHMQFDFLRKLSAKGESFVIVGRCAETILKDNPNMISIFVLGDMEQKIARTMECNNISREAAIKMIEHHNKTRKHYHNHYCETKWGDSRNYELSINSSRIGIRETANIVAQYIDTRRNISEPDNMLRG
ncbi:MAG: cytidylate kinase-like family protein [Lachnospiraceae bacterium]|nr:cytidylate kinase-like family protein [Lachnospiraceae bacterium]